MAEQNFIEIPINEGNQPQWNTRLGFPQLLNMFVGESGSLYPSPAFIPLNEKEALKVRVRALRYSTFEGGRFIVVTNTEVYRVSLTGAFTLISSIVDSGLAVQIVENDQDQVTIVDGHKAYVFSQRTGGFVTLNEPDNGFELKTPISAVVINTITIILDEKTKSWIISGANNALIWPPLANVALLQANLVEPIGLGELDSNLYIFGTGGIERWVPSLANNIYLFPFSRDENFQSKIGCLNTNSITNGVDPGGRSYIFFLSSLFVPMKLTAQGPQRLGKPGISKVISQYKDNLTPAGSFYSFRGYYFYQLTYETTKLGWVYNINTDTWAFSDDLILSAEDEQDIVGTPDGIFEISLIPSYKLRSFQSARIINYKGLQPYRNLLNGVEVRMIQGFLQTKETQLLSLTLSLDSKSWLNTVTRPIGKTGERQAVVTWLMNVAAYEYTIRTDYHGDLDFIIEKIFATIR